MSQDAADAGIDTHEAKFDKSITTLASQQIARTTHCSRRSLSSTCLIEKVPQALCAYVLLIKV
jgi:hypothetical protein